MKKEAHVTITLPDGMFMTIPFREDRTIQETIRLVYEVWHKGDAERDDAEEADHVCPICSRIMHTRTRCGSVYNWCNFCHYREVNGTPW